jgi:alpha-tubulin suppressor-like RCC1 family protein
MALAKNKKGVFSWGYGEDGQLGHGNTADTQTPKQIEFFKNKTISMIDCGHSHSGAIVEGQVYMWGCNTDSRLVLESGDNVISPTLTLMSELQKEDPSSFYATKISLGVTHSAIITKSGELFTAGSKVDGQLGAQIDDSTVSNDHNESELAVSCPLNQVLPFGDDNSPLAIDVS